MLEAIKPGIISKLFQGKSSLIITIFEFKSSQVQASKGQYIKSKLKTNTFRV